MRSQIQAIAKLKSWQTKLATRTACSIGGSIILITSVVTPASAQLPIPGGLQLPGLTQTNNNSSTNNSNRQTETAWVRLYPDGRRLIQIADTREQLPERLAEIEQRLQSISQDYFQSGSEEINVEVLRVRTKNEDNQSVTYPVLYVNNQRLLTVTDLDAKIQGEEDPFRLAQRWKDSLQQELESAKQERELAFLERQAAVAGGVFLAMVLCSWGARRVHRRLQLHPRVTATTPTNDSVTTQLTQQQRRNMQEVRRRLFQLTQGWIWGSGTLFILGLFPYTRFIQVWVLTALPVPLLLGVVVIGTYVVIRLSYFLIDRFTTALAASNALLGGQDYVRLQLRVTTISGVAKSIATLCAVVIGALIALSTVGVDIVPLIAGAGLIGVAVSLASQSLIKDAINGFLIIVEDQYAIGDVINVGTFGGLVENLNLRITQLRDAEGRLITIPNSEVKTVANLSSRWSRADLVIPVAYDADIDRAIALIDSLGVEMDLDPRWQEQIIERPQVLGIDNFDARGLMIRVWIKTQPLKQWDVAREFRRRLKIAFDREHIDILVPQHAIWLNNPQSLTSPSDSNDSSAVAQSVDHRGKR